MLKFGVSVLDFGVPNADFWVQVLKFGVPVPDFGVHVHILAFQVLFFGYQLPGFGVPVAGFWAASFWGSSCNVLWCHVQILGCHVHISGSQMSGFGVHMWIWGGSRCQLLGCQLLGFQLQCFGVPCAHFRVPDVRFWGAHVDLGGVPDAGI